MDNSSANDFLKLLEAKDVSNFPAPSCQNPSSNNKEIVEEGNIARYCEYCKASTFKSDDRKCYLCGQLFRKAYLQ